MSGKGMKFGDKKVKKTNFYGNKIDDIDVNEILVSKKADGKRSSFKYLIMMTLDHFV